MEILLVIGIVMLAAAGVGYGLYRSAAGKSGCAGCGGCSEGQKTCEANKPRR
jgi:flagellar basal body-associated protein FliL